MPLMAILRMYIFLSPFGGWLQELKKHNVQMVVRVCEPTYSVDELKKENIDVTDLAYDDGTSPPNEVSTAIPIILVCCFFSQNLILCSGPRMIQNNIRSFESMIT